MPDPGQTQALRAGDGAALHVTRWVPATGHKAVVCLVHGLGEHCGRYAHVAEALNQAGAAVLGLDLRGHGRSAGKRGHITNYSLALDDVGLLLSEARRLDSSAPVFLYGHSLGGNIVLNCLLRRRPSVAGAIVTSPLLLPGFEPPVWKMTVGRLAHRVAPGLCLASGLAVDGLTAAPGTAAAYLADPLVHDRVSARLALDMLEAGRWALRHGAELRTPLLLMVGGEDAIVSPRAVAEFAGTAGALCVYRSWPSLKHELHNEATWPEVTRVIALWLDQRLAAAP